MSRVELGTGKMERFGTNGIFLAFWNVGCYLLRRSFQPEYVLFRYQKFSAETPVAHRHLASFRCSDMLRVRQRCRFLAIQLRSRELSMNRSYDPRRNTTYSRDLFRFLRPHPGDSRGTT